VITRRMMMMIIIIIIVEKINSIKFEKENNTIRHRVINKI
jgi:hypothetical protein